MIFRLNSRGRIVAILATDNHQDLSLLRGFDFVSLVEDDDRALALTLLSTKDDRGDTHSAILRLKLSMDGSSRYKITSFRDNDLFLLADAIDVDDSVALDNFTPLRSSPSPDSSQSQSVQNALDSSKQKTRLLFDKLPLALFVVSSKGLIEAGNAVACEMFQYNAKQLAALPISELLREINSELHLVDFLKRMIGRTCRISGRRCDGDIFPAEIHTQFLDDSGELLLLSIFDISKQEELERFRSELQRVLRHDIRGPLTSIRLFLDTIKKGLYRTKSSERLEERATLMYSEATKLVERTSGLLAMDKLDTDPATYEWANVAIPEFVRECLTELSSYEGKIELNRPIPERQILSDSARLKRAFCNLLKLMIDSSSDGGFEKVSLTFEVEERELRFVVTGGGNLEHLAEDLQLSLAMSRALIEACGGSVESSSPAQANSRISIVFMTE